MGCCVSSTKDSVPQAGKTQCSSMENQPIRMSVSCGKGSENRGPPPVEEETVKEVLAETQKRKPHSNELEPEKKTQNPLYEKTHQGREKSLTRMPVHTDQETGTASEVCSLSESASTATIADKREGEEEEDEFRPRVYGSPANLSKNQTFSGSKRERAVGKSPSRRSEISPCRKNNGSGSMRWVESSTTGIRDLRTEPKRLDLGNQSGRRSRSPATRTDTGAPASVVGRSLSARRTNPSPGRTHTYHDVVGSVKKSGPPKKDNKWASTNESLENPLVSLECFIFL